ncbi:MAG: DUF4911 domain-containing protein [Halanaerobiales bacterium]|nr:DUF4911 domain-containing protein [Halanaerobiales bacterium]
MELNTKRIVAKIPQEEIVFVDMVFKSFEGIAMLTVSKDDSGEIYLDVTEGTRDLVLDILDDLSNKFEVEIIST